MFDPLTSEARSPIIAGLTEACNKLSSVLDMKIGTFTDLQLNEVYIGKDDRCRIYQAPLGNKLWLDDPSPVIRKNGIVITQETDNFTIDFVGGSIAFERGSQLNVTDLVTADASYIIDNSNTISNIIARIDDVSKNAGKFKGYFISYDALTSTLTSASAGDYAIVGGTDNSLYIWNSADKAWKNTFKETDLSDYYTKAETDSLLSQKEANIASHGETESSDNFYYGGRKTWIDMFLKVRNTPLTGLDITDESNVEATDNILSAIGKLQAQVKGYVHDLFGTSAPTESLEGTVGQEYTNTSNGNKYHLVSIEDGNYLWNKYQDSSKSATVTLVSTDWVEETVGEGETAYTIFTQTANVEGVIADGTKQNILTALYPSKENLDVASASPVYCTDQGDGTLTFKAFEISPESDIIFNIEIQNT